MAEIKAYTDIKASKKLAEILPLESADMYYPYFGDNEFGETPRFGEGIEFSGSKDIPCWSLAALLKVLKFPELIQSHECTWLVRVWDNNSYPWSVGGFDNPVDACYEMVIKLNERNLLY